MSKKAVKLWTTKEMQYLLNNNGKITSAMACEYLNRSVSSVQGKASQLGVKFTHKNRLDTYAYYEKDMLVMMASIEEISKQTGMTIRELYRYQYPSVKKLYRRELVKIEEDYLAEGWSIWMNTLSKLNIMDYMNNGV